MPLFSRSSERRSHRFSLRKYHRPSDIDAASVAGLSENHVDRKARRQTQPTVHEPDQTIVKSQSLSSKALQAPPPMLSSSVRSSSSTLRSTSPTLNENLSGGENDTEISDTSEECVTRDSGTTLSQGRVASQRNSRHSSEHTSCNRPSLAEYRQLQCSMSYKKRVNSDTFRGTSIASSQIDSRVSERMNDLQSSEFRMTNLLEQSCSSRSLLNARISESSTTITMPHSVVTVVSTDSSMFSSDAQIPDIPITSQITEANVAALQTRRAFQQMVLALEDEDSGDDDDSDSEARRRSRAESAVNAGVVRLGAEEYRMFQFRLRQLEELTTEQSRKQIAAEQSIEQEVQTRTQKAIETMEKQISMYKQVKELECEREVQRRVSEHLEHPRSSRSLSRTSTTPRSSAAYGVHSSSSVGSLRDSYNISASIKEEGRSFEKLLHPRRSRKRVEQMKVREEAQKRDLEQLWEFIRTTEMRIPCMDSAMSETQMARAKQELKELDDPLLPESVLQSSPLELIHLICILRENGRKQEKQIEEAKRLVTAAIEARTAAEATAREAVELTLMLDARLDREERKTMRQARKLELRCARESREARAGSSDWQSVTPSSSSALP